MSTYSLFILKSSPVSSFGGVTCRLPRKMTKEILCLLEGYMGLLTRPRLSAQWVDDNATKEPISKHLARSLLSSDQMGANTGPFNLKHAHKNSIAKNSKTNSESY